MARRRELGHEPAGVRPGDLEVLGRPRSQRRHVVGLAVHVGDRRAGGRRRAVRPDVAGVHEQRLVLVRAHERSDRRAGGSTSPGPGRAASGWTTSRVSPASDGQRRGDGVQVLAGHQRDRPCPASGRGADPRCRRRPGPAAWRSCRRVVSTPRNRPPATSKPVTRVSGTSAQRIGRHGAAAPEHRPDGPDRLGDAVDGHVVRAQELARGPAAG